MSIPEQKQEQAQRYLAQHQRELDDLHYILAPLKYSDVMLEVFTAQVNAGLKPFLILYHRAEQRQHIEYIEYRTSINHYEQLAAFSAEAQWQHDFKLTLTTSQEHCVFSARSQHGATNIDLFVSRLLGISLHSGRPLRHYGCTFYLPLDLFLETDLAHDCQLNLFSPQTEHVERHCVEIDEKILKKERDSPKAYEKQAYLYFLPHLRDVIFESRASTAHVYPIAHWRLRRLEGMTLTVAATPTQMAIQAQITDVSLYHYQFNNLYLLAILVAPITRLAADSSLHRDDNAWWHDLFFADNAAFKDIQALQLCHWLRFTYHARIIYPSFIEQVDEQKFIPMSLETAQQNVKFSHDDEFSPLLIFLLNYFFQNELLRNRLNYLPDDRMIATPAYGLAGRAPQTTGEQAHIRRLFSLALYVDRVEDSFDDLDGYAYDPAFTQQLLQQDSLSRWHSLGTHLGYCRYANAYLGFGGFFTQVIAPSHIPYIYGRMLILALFYQMTLRHYNRRISYATEQLSKHKKTNEFKKLRQTFIQFTNNYWFHEITTQVQGIEIFELQTKSLGLKSEYQLIKDEMERADEYSFVLRSENFNRGAGAVAIAALVISVLSIEVKSDVSWLRFLNEYAFSVSLGLTVLAIGFLSWLFFKSR